jgi:putative SOS response-associated peptidase YedK
VPTDGFYEWRPRAARHRQPYLIRRADGRPFAIAGLWERWQSPDGTELQTCTLLTTTANPLVAPIHDRMPVILAGSDQERWLDPAEHRPDLLCPLLHPYRGDDLVAFPVSQRVNTPAYDDPQCVQPLSDLLDP